MLYTEKKTRLIYEAKLYEDYVLIRPVSSGYDTRITRMGEEDFNENFEEYAGIHDNVYRMMGGQTDLMIESK